MHWTPLRSRLDCEVAGAAPVMIVIRRLVRRESKKGGHIYGKDHRQVEWLLS